MDEAPQLHRVCKILDIVKAAREVSEIDWREGVYGAGIATEGDELGVCKDAGDDVEEEEGLGIL